MPNNDDDKIAADVLARLQKLILELSHDLRKRLLQQAQDLLAAEPPEIQRTSARKQYSTYVNFFLKDDSHWGLSRDISKSGMFIETYEPFSVNRKIKIFLPNPDNTKIIEVPAKIARATPDGIGVVFMM